MELIVKSRGETLEVSIERRMDDGGASFDVKIDDRTHRVDWRHVGAEVRSAVVAGRQHEVAVRHLGDGTYEVAGSRGPERVEVKELLAHLAETTHAATGRQGVHQVTAYMPGRVVALLVEKDATVKAGQGLLVLEAMKMENEIKAESDGVVREIFVEVGQAVEGGDPLYELES